MSAARPVRSGTPGGRTRTLDGLRGIAVAAVVVEHAVPGVLPGGFAGVDLFFVLSGYLITGLVLAELAASGRLDLAAFYARRVRRIVPAALLAIAGTALIQLAILGPALQPELPREVLATALAGVNLLFAARSTDYFAADPSSSPLLHFWSLAVEEQFYLLWPALLVALAVAAARRGRVALRGAGPGAVLAAIALASGIGMLVAPAHLAFYLLPFRGWELAAGGLLAWVRIRRPDRLPGVPPSARAAGTLLGATAVATVLLLVPALGDWPGPGTVVAVAGTLLLVAAGDAMPGARLLAAPPLRWLGRISYALYLWHWPLLAAARLLALPEPSPGPVAVAAALLLAIVAATASTLLVEERIRRARHPRLQGWGAVRLAAGALAVLAVAGQLGLEAAPRALARSGGLDAALLAARTERSRIRDDRCQSGVADPPEPVTCVYGAAAGPGGAPGTTTGGLPVVVLVGDSHARSWFAALDAWASRRGWALVTIVRTGCRAELGPVGGIDATSPACRAWREAAVGRIAALRPGLTVVASSRRFGGPVTWEERAGAFLAAAAAGSGRTLLLGEVPRPGFDVPACLAVHRDDPARCSRPLAAVTDAELVAAERAAAAAAGVSYVATVPWICTGDPCGWLVAGAPSYYDDHHITEAAALAALPELAVALDLVVAAPPGDG